MNTFKYTFLSTSEIFEKINYLSQNLFPEIVFIILAIFIVFILNNYIFPTILFWVENYKKEKMKNERKNLLKQIMLQREIEDEIEKSL